LAGCFADIPQYVLSRLNLIAEKSYSKDSETESCQSSQSGMMCEPLTENHGADLLMSCAVGSPARTSVALEKERESKDQEVVCGNTWRESSVKFDLDTLSWKTHRCLWEEDLAPSSLILPKWGMMQSGELWERITSPLPTEETESGSWPTPRCQMTRYVKVREGGDRGNLEEIVANRMTYPMPTNHNSRKPKDRKNAFGNLTMQVMARWPTPTAHNAKECDAPSEASRNEPTLTSQARGGDQTQPKHLNPPWVEWLMGWPLFWTALDINVKPYYDSWHEAQQRTQASPEKIQSGIMRNVWWNIDPSTPSQGRQPYQQREIECDGSMPVMPCENTLPNRELGIWKCEAVGMQDLQGDIQTEADAEIEAMWQAGMPKGKRETISKVAVGVKNRNDRLKAIGNGQVSSVAKLAWSILKP